MPDYASSPRLHAKFQNAVILEEYDGEISEEPQPITTHKTGTTRNTAPHPKHPRRGHRRRYDLLDSVRIVGIPPTIIHLEDYAAKELKKLGFSPDGTPTLEAMIKYQGNLTDNDIKLLHEQNKYQTMTEVYNKKMPKFDYTLLHKIFNQ
jgi:hypothetical protein